VIKKQNMILKELIKKYTWGDIKSTLFEHYPDMVKSDEGFQIMYDKLLHIEPKANTYEIVLQNIEEEGEDAYVHVNATNLDPQASDETAGSWSLMGTPLNKWLFMPISKESKENFTEIEIMVHCLWEMSFCGFDDESIQEFNDKLDEEMDGFEILNSEEIKEKYTSFDEIKEKYNYPKDD
jgi:hypothetical protein